MSREFYYKLKHFLPMYFRHLDEYWEDVVDCKNESVENTENLFQDLKRQLHQAIEIMVSMLPEDEKYISSDVCYFQNLETAYRAAIHIWKACIEPNYGNLLCLDMEKCTQLFNIILDCIQTIKTLNAITEEALGYNDL